MVSKPIEYDSVFAPHIREYVGLKNLHGYKFTIESYMLRQFDRYCREIEVRELELSAAVMDNWLAMKPDDKAATRGSRISTLKGFRDYLQNQGQPVSWNPLPGHTSGLHQSRYVPYIFTRDEIGRVFKSADSMRKKPVSNFHLMFPIILRILYGCGLRVSEAVSLRQSDIDVSEGCITVHQSKFEKSRRIPISDSLKGSLKTYIKSDACGIDENGFLFPNKNGSHYSKRTVYDTFRQILQKSGIPYQGKGKGPRLHDIRHTFAVHSLQKHIDEGRDAYTMLPILASYLGHTDVSTTEHYLRLTAEFYPELLAKSDMITKNVIPEVARYEK